MNATDHAEAYRRASRNFRTLYEQYPPGGDTGPRYWMLMRLCEELSNAYQSFDPELREKIN